MELSIRVRFPIVAPRYNRIMNVYKWDARAINVCKQCSVSAARISLFVVYFWFGLLKVIGLSPATDLVRSLSDRTIPFVDFGTFFIAFGLFECLIGLLFLFRGAERVVIPMLVLHLVTTAGPLVLLPQLTWAAFMVPTLEGQYIIKNFALISLAIGIAASLVPKQDKC